jgi:hypothetical protein
MMRIKAMCCALGVAVSLFVCRTQADVVGHWTLDEKSGTVATDSSGKGHHGTYVNNPGLGVPGALPAGTAMNTATGYLVADLGADLPTGADERTIALWLKPVTNNIDRKFLAYGNTTAGGAFSFTIEPVNGVMGVRLRHWGGNFTYPGVTLNEWQHVAIVVPPGSSMTSHVRVYLNGINSSGTMTTSPDRNLVTGTSRFFVGTVHDNPGAVFDGTIDDVWFFDHALTVEGIAAVMAGESGDVASSPIPQDGATDVPRDVVLGWTAGQFAATHDVYFGAAADVVAAATRANPTGVLVSRDRTAPTFAPAGLAYGRTYYWRVDEVNAAPDSTVFKGDVWSFTVEPYAYPIRSVTATASSAQAGMGPENTVNGSGLDKNDGHSTELKEMWMSAGVQPNWIQYRFDQAYKLHELWIWNSNQLVEPFVGFGARNASIEYSTDGVTWTQLQGVPEFARGTGSAAYVHNTTVNFGGVSAQYVKLTIAGSWGNLPQTSLAEVRFFQVPVQAREPQPANGAAGVGLDATLNWRPGRQAASHQVFFGTDPNALPAAATVTDHSHTPNALSFGTTYYWRVNEANAVDGVTHPGPVWSFTTQPYAVVEDFESYTDDEGSRIYQTWIDGWTNATGAVVGYLQAPFAERTIVHGGKQAMPLEYNNTKTPYYSETERVFAPVQNWTGHGADTLVVYFQGRPAGFLEKSATDFLVGGGGTDIWNTADQFRLAAKRLTGNGAIAAKVVSLVNTDPWAKIGVMIRESLAPGSRFAAVYATPGNGVRYQGRLTTDVAAVSDSAVATAAQIALRAPVWVKIERAGSNFNGFYSTDGATWTAMSWNPQTINMTASPVYIGLCVTSHNVNALTTAEFSNVATTGNVTGAWEVAEIGVAQPGNVPSQLYVVVQDSAGQSKVVKHPDPGATTLVNWQEWTIPLSDLSGVNLAAVKKLSIGVGDRTNPTPGGAGRLYLDDIGFGHPAR